MRRFIVTGCPRSGTSYATALFAALGVRMGHEDVFGVREAMGGKADWDGYDGDASWLAAPLLPLDGVVVLHQVRHPLEFVRSMVGFASPGLLSDERARNPFPRVIGRNAPEVYRPAGEAERAATMWVAWNEMVRPHAHRTYPIEQLDTALLLDLCRLVELDVSAAHAERALAGISKTTNRIARDESVQWGDIEPIVGAVAGRYGYGAGLIG